MTRRAEEAYAAGERPDRLKAANGADASVVDVDVLDDEGEGVDGAPEGREPTTADRMAQRLDVWSAQRERREVHFLRYVPTRSPIHELWAGTKFVAVGALSIALFVWPTWPSLAVVAGLLILVLVLLRIPRSAAPRIPAWILAFVAVGALIALISGGPPIVHIGGIRVGLGGIEQWTRFAVLAIELLVATTIVGWTTPLAELAPAISRLAAPLRRLRVPVDELAVSLALSIRCLPLVIEELRTLRDARRSRRPATPRNASEMARDGVELAVAALLNALRRASELAAAIEARGGATVVRHDGRGPRRGDWVALGVLACVITAMGVVG
jgi:energy-coupling factor transporter transmembrane protein EcfT